MSDSRLDDMVDIAAPAGATDTLSEPRRRRARRVHPARGRRMPRRRVAALGIVGVAAVGWVAYASPVTLVEHVVVQAPHGMSQDALRLASGIAATDHVPAVDADRVRVAIMSELPAVADVQVRRSLPHTIRLVVTARSALAAVESGKGYYLMDADGVLFDKVATAKGVPVVQAGTDVGRDTARAVLTSMPAQLRAKVKQVTATTGDDVTLELRGGAQVRWGSAQDAELKAKVLAGLMALKAASYDVTAPMLPTTTGGEVGTGTAG